MERFKSFIYCQLGFLLLLVGCFFTPCYGYATYDATGSWAATENCTFSSGSPPYSFNATWVISQTSMAPNDYFTINSFYYGHVNNALYTVEGPTPAEIGVPLSVDPLNLPIEWFPDPHDPGYYLLQMYDQFSFTLINSTSASGYLHIIETGYLWFEGTLIYDPSQAGVTVADNVTLSRVVPIPSALLLVGSGLIPFIRLRKKRLIAV